MAKLEWEGEFESGILNFSRAFPDLTLTRLGWKLSATPSKGNPMTGQVNWQKIRNEINRLTDVEQLKSEVHRIGTEIRKFDFHTVLSPAAQQKMKKFEKRYATLMRSISQAQRQMDREFNRVLRQIKSHRSDVEKVVTQQKSKLEKAAGGFRKRFSKKSTAKAKRPSASAAGKRGSSKTARTMRKKA